MHQCDYCCWYYSMSRGCECPVNMKGKACAEASNKKAEADKVLQKKTTKKSVAPSEPEVAKREENYRLEETTCTQCKKKYKAQTTRDTNAVGMWMEYSYCPDCQHKNLIAWHVW